MSTRILKVTHKINGVLTDADSVVLRDPSNTFGVQRTDTAATVVAAGTAMVKQSTGIYTYSFTDPAPGLTYRFWPIVTLDGNPITMEMFSYPVSFGAMTLTEARKLVRQFAKNASSSNMYSDEEIDRAIQTVCLAVTHDLQLQKVKTPITFTVGSGDVDVADLLAAGAAPHHILSMYLTGGGALETARLDVVDAEKVYEERVINGSTSGQPRLLAWEDDSHLICFPAPDKAYTAQSRWFNSFQCWEPGDEHPDNIAIGMPREIAQAVMVGGVPFVLQMNENDKLATAIHQQGWYKEMTRVFRSQGSLGAKIAYRQLED